MHTAQTRGRADLAPMATSLLGHHHAIVQAERIHGCRPHTARGGCAGDDSAVAAQQRRMRDRFRRTPMASSSVPRYPNGPGRDADTPRSRRARFWAGQHLHHADGSSSASFRVFGHRVLLAKSGDCQRRQRICHAPFACLLGGISTQQSGTIAPSPSRTVHSGPRAPMPTPNHTPGRAVRLQIAGCALSGRRSRLRGADVQNLQRQRGHQTPHAQGSG
jgi:hypothetical protein